MDPVSLAEELATALNDEQHDELKLLAERLLAADWPPDPKTHSEAFADFTRLRADIHQRVRLYLHENGQVNFQFNPTSALHKVALIQVVASPELRRRFFLCGCGHYAVGKSAHQRKWCSSKCAWRAAQRKYRERHPERYKAQQRERMKKARREGKPYAK